MFWSLLCIQIKCRYSSYANIMVKRILPSFILIFIGYLGSTWFFLTSQPYNLNNLILFIFWLIYLVLYIPMVIVILAFTLNANKITDYTQ